MKVFDTDEQSIIGKITKGSGYSRTLINIFYSRSDHTGLVSTEIDGRFHLELVADFTAIGNNSSKPCDYVLFLTLYSNCLYHSCGFRAYSNKPFLISLIISILSSYFWSTCA